VRSSVTPVTYFAMLFLTGCGAQPSGKPPTLAFRGIVTYSADHVLFLQNRNGAIKVDTTGIASPPRINTLLEAQGTVLRTPGLPVLVRPRLSMLGSGVLPAALRARAADLPNAQFAGQLVDVAGIAQSEGVDRDGLLRVRIRDGEQIITARLTDNADLNRDTLRGALITVRGVADPVVNTDGKVEDYRVWSSAAVSLKIVKPAIRRRGMTVSTVSQVKASPSAFAAAAGQVRLHGQVIEDGQGGLTFKDSTGALPMQMAQQLLPFSGRDLWVWAFPRVLPTGLLLEDAEIAEAEQSTQVSPDHSQNTLHRIVDIRSMSPREAAKQLPVRIEATVTYSSPTEGLLFVQDETAGIYIDLSGPAPVGITAGWRVRVEGSTSGGGFAPSIYHAHVLQIGEAPLPRPAQVTTEGLLSAGMDSQYIQVEGVARSVEQARAFLILHLANGPVRFTAYLSGWDKVPEYLLGSRLRLIGACGSSFNALRQFNGLEIYLQNPGQLQVVKPHMAAFELPIRPVTSLLEFSPSGEPGTQVRLRGVVTMVTPSDSAYVRDSSGGLEIIPAAAVSLAPGDFVDAAGYVKATRLGAVLEDAVIQTLRHGSAPEPLRTSAYQILDNNVDSALVELDAKLISQAPAMGEVNLLLNSAGTYFSATLDDTLPLGSLVEPGSMVRIRGICVLHPPASTSDNIPRSFELRLRTAGDITLLKGPPWWTAEHAFRIVLSGGFLLAAALAWVLILRRKVKQQTATIEKKLLTEEALRTEAQSASHAKGEFLANMSHEIRTPVNAIIGYARLALASAAEGETREHLEIIAESGSALVGIINDILDLSKIEAGCLTLETISFSLRQEVQAALRIFRLEAERKGVELSLHIDEAIPSQMTGDPLRLRQVLLNLVGNAVKFTSQGFVRVSITPEDCSNQTTRLRFSVADSGIGIPLDKQQAVFNAFTQADYSISRQHGGTGLGLTISAKLVGLAGGQISLQSTPGKGTEFQFTLPFGEALSDITPLAPLPVPALRAGLSFLVAEDNTVNQRLMKALLERAGHRVEIAANGRIAIERLARSECGIDVVLMDVQMPECDGYQAAREIRELERTRHLPRIPIVALTAHAMEGDRRRCLDSGMDGYATKPVELNALLQEVAACLPNLRNTQPQLTF
jgi:signal transduction histidine kinase/CheY-like chemotaxis protein